MNLNHLKDIRSECVLILLVFLFYSVININVFQLTDEEKKKINCAYIFVCVILRFVDWLELFGFFCTQQFD